MRSFFTIPRHPFELHELARTASAKTVAAYVNYLQRHKPEVLKSLLSTIDDYGFFPLSKAYFNSDHEEAYSVLIILLEAGADPYARPVGGELNGRSLLHELIEYKCLALVRLLLWYDPHYESVLDHTGTITAAKRIETWSEACKSLPKEFLQKIISETARDAKQVIELRLLAEQAESDDNLTQAIDYYLQINRLYLKQQKVERTLPYFNVYDKGFEAKRPFMIKYYEGKAKLFKEKALKCALRAYQVFQLQAKSYESKSLHSLEDKVEHRKRLERLADLARMLTRPGEAVYYSSQCARLTVELSRLRSDSEEVVESVHNPLLGPR